MEIQTQWRSMTTTINKLARKHLQAIFFVMLCLFIGLGPVRASNEQVVMVLSQLNVNPTMAYAFVADHLGYWSTEDLKVDIQYSKGSAQTLLLLAAGKADVGQSNEIQLMLAREKGLPLRVVMTFARQFGSKLGVLANSPIKSIEQLRGKNIGVASLSAAQVPFAKAMIASANLDPNIDVSLVAVGYGAQPLAALLSGQVSAAAFWLNQFDAWEVAGHKFRFFPTPFFPNDTPGYNFVAHDNMILDRERALVGLLKGIAKALLFAETNPEAALEIFYRANPTKKPIGANADELIARDLELLKRAIKLYSINERKIKQWGASYKPGWKAVRDFYIAQGALRDKRPVEEYYVSPKITDMINEFDGGSIVKSAQTFK
jgi:NitT/TauT family transport system substrate-binding protein